jgi:hypothetical protein
LKGPRLYKNLYEFQTEKVFTLQEFSDEKPKRDIVRKHFHLSMFSDFMRLLEKTYP